MPLVSKEGAFLLSTGRGTLTVTDEGSLTGGEGRCCSGVEAFEGRTLLTRKNFEVEESSMEPFDRSSRRT